MWWGNLFQAMDKIFCPWQKIFCSGQNYFVLDKSDFVQDKKHFVRADGQGMNFNLLLLFNVLQICDTAYLSEVHFVNFLESSTGTKVKNWNKSFNKRAIFKFCYLVYTKNHKDFTLEDPSYFSCKETLKYYAINILKLNDPNPWMPQKLIFLDFQEKSRNFPFYILSHLDSFSIKNGYKTR